MQAALREQDFAKYPPEAKQVAIRHVDLLEQLPVAFAVVFLRQMIDYDWRFPAERAEVDDQLRYLGAMSPATLQATMAGFASLTAASAIVSEHWWTDPIAYTEKLTAQLWPGTRWTASATLPSSTSATSARRCRRRSR